MKKLISIILSLCLLLTFAAAENAPAAQETAAMTAEELYEAGEEAADAGEYDKAKTLYEQAAEKGSTAALLSIGYLYDQGYGVEQNTETAQEYYRKAYESGDRIALELLARLVEAGIIQVDYKANPE